MPNKAVKSEVMSEEAFQHLMRKFTIIGWSTLVVDDVDHSSLDAFTLDASCQSRVPGLLNALSQAQRVLGANLTEFQSLCRQYLDAHASDTRPIKVRTIDEAIGATDTPIELVNYMNRVREGVDKGLFEIVGLCYANNINTFTYYDEMGCRPSVISDHIYKADQMEVPTRIVNHTYELRAHLGVLSTEYMTKISREAASNEFRNAKDTLIPWCSFRDQVAAALEHITSFVPQKEGPAIIPLQGCAPQILLMLINAFDEGRPLITQHRRICMIPIQHTEDYTYRLTDARTCLWYPDKQKGGFRYQNQISVREKLELGVIFDMPSYYKEGAQGEGLSSSNDDEFFATLTSPNTDPVWLLAPILAAHPAFTGYANAYANYMNPNHKIRAVYERVSPRDMIKSRYYNRLWCKGLSFNLTMDNNQLTLFAFMHYGSIIANEYGHAESTTQFAQDIKSYFIRRRTPIDSIVEHISIGNFAESERRCKYLMALHGQDRAALIGSYLCRTKGVTISFLTREEAAITTKRINKKRSTLEKYKLKYPHNYAFFPTESSHN